MMLFRTLRNLLIPALLAVALLAGALTVFIVLNKPINNRLNPFESFALHCLWQPELQYHWRRSE
jgi:hypothetical protein